MKVACSASLLGYHFLNHSGLLDFLLREEKGMCKINVSRSLVLPAEWVVKCIFAILHLPSGDGRYSSPFIGLLENQFILQFVTSFGVFCSSFYFYHPVMSQCKKNNIVSLRHCGENLSGP